MKRKPTARTKAAGFSARYEVTEEMLRHGVLADDAGGECLPDAIWKPMNALAEECGRARAVLPSPEGA